MENKAKKPPFARIDQVGVIVRDMDEAVKYYESLGIGPFKAHNVTPIGRKVRGKPADDVKNISRAAQVGGVQFELVQPVEGKSVQREFLEGRGEGINHLAFFVDDIEKGTAELIKKGYKIISEGKFVVGGGFAYFDTDKIGGVIFELVQWPPK